MATQAQRLVSRTTGAAAEASSLEKRAAPSDPALSRAAELIWVAAQRSTWSSLALVPAEPGISVGPIAAALAAVGGAQRGEPVQYLDLRGVGFADSRPAAETLADRAAPSRLVAALDCPLDSQAAQLLASAANLCVLVVAKDRTDLAQARRLVDSLGKERLLGAVIIDPAA